MSLFTADSITASIKDRLVRAVKTYAGEWYGALSDLQRGRVLASVEQIASHLFNALIEPDDDSHFAFVALALDTLKTDAVTANIRAADRIGDAWAKAFGGFVGKKLDGVKIPFGQTPGGDSASTPAP